MFFKVGVLKDSQNSQENTFSVQASVQQVYLNIILDD